RPRRRPAQAQPGDRFPHPDGTGVPRMTTTTPTPPPGAPTPAPGAPAPSAGPDPSRTVAVITGAPEPHPTTWKTFAAMMAREFRVLGRNAPSTFIRAVMQPLLFAFVFAYVLPKIGSGFGGAGTGVSFATILVPGLMGS